MSPYFSYGFNSNGRQLLCVSHPWTSRPWSLRNGEQSCKGIRDQGGQECERPDLP